MQDIILSVLHDRILGLERLMTTDLQQNLSSLVLRHARNARLVAGAPLKESRLAGLFGVSRTPVRAALDLLAERGVVRHESHRGYFLLQDAADIALPDGQSGLGSTTEAVRDAYAAILGQAFDGKLNETFSEAHLQRQLGAERDTVRSALVRLAEEGIVKQRAGYGWELAELLTTPAADEESYRFRLVVEPAALLEPSFRIDVQALDAVRAEQEELIRRTGLLKRIEARDVFDANARFHELLAQMSGNRHILDAIVRQSRLRRLLEYRNYVNLDMVAQSCREHLEIIAAIVDRDQNRASKLMKDHIQAALTIRPAFGANAGRPVDQPSDRNST